MTVFDNTKGQYIDFDKKMEEWNSLSSGNIPDGTGQKGAARHAFTVETCMNLIGKPFVLFDSDVIIKKDFSGIVRKEYIFSSYVNVTVPNWKIRSVPFICYINVDKCREHDIHYFYIDRMLGIKTVNWYNTGAAFYEEASKYRFGKIKWRDYVHHLKAGSWQKYGKDSWKKFIQAHKDCIE